MIVHDTGGNCLKGSGCGIDCIQILLHIMLSDPSFRLSNSKAQKNKPKRPPFRLTYEMAGDLEAKFKPSKATALTKATLQKYTKKNTTLPEDLHFQADQLFRLFLRQNIMVGYFLEG